MVKSDKQGNVVYMVRSKLPELVLAKEKELGRRIQINEIAEETGISRPTISAWMSHRPFAQINADTLIRLMHWSGKQSYDDLLEPVEINES